MLYSSLVKFVKNILRPTDLVLKAANSKAFIGLMVRATVFVLYGEMICKIK